MERRILRRILKKMLSKIYGTALKPGVETISYEKSGDFLGPSVPWHSGNTFP